MGKSDDIQINAAVPEETSDIQMELSDEDILMDFELRCAVQDGSQLPDVEQEFERFEAEYLKPKTTRTLFKYTAFVAAAACLAFVIFFTWQKDDNTSNIGQPIADENSFVSPPPMDGMELMVGNKAVALGSAAARQRGIFLTNDSMIRFLSPENVAPEDRNTITIPQGKVAHIQLPDGSKVYLSARSRLIFPQRFIEGRPREVRLIGEGYFEVARNESCPFIVHSNDVSTRVLGTVFNIRCFEGETPVVTLVSGSVQVSREGTDDVVLKPGQQAILDKRNMSFDIETANIDDVVAWKDGLFSFRKHTLRDVLVEVARWYNLNVSFKNDEHLNDSIHYNGDRAWTIRQVVEQLNDISSATITLKEGTLVVD